jgi:hypothetical protein
VKLVQPVMGDLLDHLDQPALVAERVAPVTKDPPDLLDLKDHLYVLLLYNHLCMFSNSDRCDVIFN